MVGGRPGRTPGPRGAGGYVSEPHMPVTTATRPYPRITLFFYFYPPSPSRRPARTHARFCTSRWGKFKRRHVLKSAPGARHSAPLRLNSPEISLFLIGGTPLFVLLFEHDGASHHRSLGKAVRGVRGMLPRNCSSRWTSHHHSAGPSEL